MTHFGIICPPTAAHLNPMIAIAHELQQRGHQVTIFGPLDAEAKVAIAGLDFWAVGTSEYPLGTVGLVLSQFGQLNNQAALQFSLKLAKKTVSFILQEVPPAVKQAGVEVLLVDQALPGGGTVADILNIPFISFCCLLPTHQEESVPPVFTPWRYQSSWWAYLRNRVGYSLINFIAKPIRDLVNNYRREWKLPILSHPNDAYSSLAQLSLQPAEFEFPRQHLPNCFHFIGSCYDSANRQPVDFPYEKLTGQPLIYASLGTVFNRRVKIFENIAQACVGLDAQLVIDLGGGISAEDLPDLSGEPFIIEFAPQLELVQKATLFINHGGFNTVIESLSYGVPVVAIPMANDHLGTATRLEWTGAGEVIPFKRLTVSKLRDAIQRVLTQDSYRQNAAQLQQAIRRAGGVSRAADIIEQVVQTRNPVLANAIVSR